MRKLIERLSELRGTSGHEYRISDLIAAEFEPYADEIIKSPLGSVIAVKKCGIENAPSVMIEAHMDEIGLMVSSITDDGFVTFTDIGGVDERILPSLEVTIHGRVDVSGVIGIIPAEYTDTSKSYKSEDLAIDTGLSKAELTKLISVGDCITLPQSVGRLGKKQISLKTMDDRASVAVLVDVLKKLKNEQLSCDIYAVSAVQEEVTGAGGKTSAFSIKPDIAIAIDVTHGITPDNSESAFRLGSGTIIGKGPSLHSKLTDRLIDICKAEQIKYDLEIEGGYTGTDAWDIQTSRGGIATALLSIPLKYMHTSVETLDIRDVKATSRLITKFISGLEGDISWLSL